MDGAFYGAGKMLVLGAGASWVRALEPSCVLVLGGEPVGERFISWNLVSSSTDRLAQAAADWKAERVKLPMPTAGNSARCRRNGCHRFRRSRDGSRLVG